MPEDTQPAVAPAPVKTRRRRSLLNQRHAAALLLAGEIAGTAEKPAYAAALATEGIDAAFIADIRVRLAVAAALAAAAEGQTADRKVATQNEDACRADLLALVSLVQSRAKRKYKAADPLRAKYFVGHNLAISRVTLESAAQTILAHLATDALPGMKPADLVAFQKALVAYAVVQTTQSGDQSDATTVRARYGDRVKEISGLRREIQYAVDALWPASRKGNAGIRIEFKLRPDRASK